jgi:Transcriptional regulator, AbiEi antitoxin/Protein of unknown function (DUF559)
MSGRTTHKSVTGVWRLARAQHGVVTRAQLVLLGMTRHAIDRRIANGRLHRLHRGVFAVGRPDVEQLGRWMAGVLAGGDEAVLSHRAAAELWGIRIRRATPIEVSIPARTTRAIKGVVVHRRRHLWDRDRSRHVGIPVTSPIQTLTDLAGCVSLAQLEAAVNEADKRGLVNPDSLRAALEQLAGQPGTGVLRSLLDRRTFVLTDSELERRFLPLAHAEGLPIPETGARLSGFKVDFFWPDLGLVVETDGLRYHRTPGQQARDHHRDQAHAVAGLTVLRFTHGQVRYEPGYVRSTLRRVARRLSQTASQ